MNERKRLIRIPEVLNKTGFCKAWIYRLISRGDFPSPIKTGERTIAFVESEVDEWIDDKIFIRVIKRHKNHYSILFYYLYDYAASSVKRLKIAYRAF